MSAQTKPKLRIKPFKLIGLSIKAWLKDFNIYTKLVLAVALPVAALTILQAEGSTGDFGLTMAFAWSFTIIALIIYSYTKKSLPNHKLTNIYSLASGRFLQYLGVTLVLIAFAVPGVFGWLAILSILGQQGISALLLLVACLAAISLSIHLLIRFSLAQVITVGEKQTVYQSLLKSSRATKHNRLRIFIGFFALLLVIFIIANGIQILLSLKQSVNENVIINNLIYVLEATVFLPVIYVYQVKILEALNG